MYTLKVNTNDVDKVIFKLSEKDIEIVNVIRASGYIQVKTKKTLVLESIQEIIKIKKDGFFPQLLFF